MSGEYARSGHRTDAHTIAKKKDDILGVNALNPNSPVYKNNTSIQVLAPAVDVAGVEAARQYVDADYRLYVSPEAKTGATTSAKTPGDPSSGSRSPGWEDAQGTIGARRRLQTDEDDIQRPGATPMGSLNQNFQTDSPSASLKKRKKARSTPSEKTEKGLRHFSLRVCQKVEDKGRTTYNEVADELVAELVVEKADQQGPPSVSKSDTKQYDEKNIRRRVYDALNVLMALDVISKEKKDITWRGLPDSHDQQVEQLKLQEQQSNARIEKKRGYLKELVEQYDALTALLKRNMNNPSPLLTNGQQNTNSVALPFLLVQTRNDAQVEVEMSDDMQTVSIDFDTTPFEVHDYFYVLKNMKLS